MTSFTSFSYFSFFFFPNSTSCIDPISQKKHFNMVPWVLVCVCVWCDFKSPLVCRVVLSCSQPLHCNRCGPWLRSTRSPESIRSVSAPYTVRPATVSRNILVLHPPSPAHNDSGIYQANLPGSHVTWSRDICACINIAALFRCVSLCVSKYL